jgi:hypothetical protein
MEATRIKVWQCVGCGRIDDPQPCIGVCRDQKVEYVRAAEHDAEVAALHAQAVAMHELALSIANTTPRGGEWERGYRALQERARTLLARSGT